ncbi:hypothetical protein [Pararhizobium haloflavum]|uniref:hypothetical protein n=1 Tax=Pararhizobium haloflavum TaxID=2037914 RepID=UPI000C1A0D06|nr:hypothetical protein [Pararhizobium haloflavum]
MIFEAMTENPRNTKLLPSEHSDDFHSIHAALNSDPAGLSNVLRRSHELSRRQEFKEMPICASSPNVLDLFVRFNRVSLATIRGQQSNPIRAA